MFFNVPVKLIFITCLLLNTTACHLVESLVCCSHLYQYQWSHFACSLVSCVSVWLLRLTLCKPIMFKCTDVSKWLCVRDVWCSDILSSVPCASWLSFAMQWFTVAPSFNRECMSPSRGSFGKTLNPHWMYDIWGVFSRCYSFESYTLFIWHLFSLSQLLQIII